MIFCKSFRKKEKICRSFLPVAMQDFFPKVFARVFEKGFAKVSYLWPCKRRWTAGSPLFRQECTGSLAQKSAIIIYADHDDHINNYDNADDHIDDDDDLDEKEEVDAHTDNGRHSWSIHLVRKKLDQKNLKIQIKRVWMVIMLWRYGYDTLMIIDLLLTELITSCQSLFSFSIAQSCWLCPGQMLNWIC